jgi:hypothetical protein
MRQVLGCLTLCALLFAGGVADARSGGGGGMSSGGAASFSGARGSAMSANPASPGLSSVSPLPSRGPLNQMASPSLNEGQIGAAPNPGRVTGFGPGGLSRIPGSLPNPGR